MAENTTKPPSDPKEEIVHHDDSTASSMFGKYLERLQTLTSTHRNRDQIQEPQEHTLTDQALIVRDFAYTYWRAIAGIYFTALTIGLIAIFIHALPHHPTYALQFVNFVNQFDNHTDYNVHHNPFLQGIFTPVHTEHFSIPVEVVEGSVPDTLTGLFVRVGPNPLPFELDRRYHIFDGHGMLHALRFQKGNVIYTNQWIRTNKFNLAEQHQQSALLHSSEYIGWIGKVKKWFIRPLLSYVFQVSDVESGPANTALLLDYGKLYAGHERSLSFELAWDDQNHSFKSIGYQNFQGSLRSPVSAHPKQDSKDGRVYFTNYGISAFEDSMQVGRWLNNTLEALFPIASARRNSFAHDMFITEHYIIVIDNSLVFDPGRYSKGKPVGPLFFDKKRLLHLGVLPKNATSDQAIEWYQFDRAFGLVHTINAWESGAKIVLYAPLTEGFNTGTMLSESWKVFKLQIDLQTKETSSEVIPGSPSVEFPVIHPSMVGKPHRYAFAMRFTKHPFSFDAIERLDLLENKFYKYPIMLPEGFVGGEAVLIPKDGQTTRSSDVYLAVNVIQKQTLESQWILYDGATMSPTPFVRLRLPFRVPMGFHGLWIEEKELNLCH